MRTKTLFLLCLFLGIGLMQLSAQTTTMVFKGHETYPWPLPVFDDNGTEVDRVAYIEDDYVCTIHYVNGVPAWSTSWLHGTCSSIYPDGENFTFTEQDQRHLMIEYGGSNYKLVFNLKGDKGNHYVGILLVDYSDWDYILTPLVIHSQSNVNKNR